MRLGHSSELVGLAADLAEDVATRWVPDVIADCDLSTAVLRPAVREEDVRFVDVPRPGGAPRRVPVLSGAALGALRLAVQPLRQVSESVLDPSVCGYRTGATGDVSYSQEYRRFRTFSRNLSDDSAWVVLADIESFFDSTAADGAGEALNRQFGQAVASPVIDLMAKLHARGIPGLPAGYGDARLIANAVLAPVDATLKVPFTRWVDDYRLFASSEREAEGAALQLAQSLGEFGLCLNRSKFKILSSKEFRQVRLGVPLDSVYHAQDESPGAVHAALRAVFVDAIATGDRRRLRFALPRLAQEKDPVAIDYALAQLRENSIDSPRLVQYLSKFVECGNVAARVNSVAANPTLSDWTLMRLVPLLCQTGLDKRTGTALSERAKQTESSLLWGLLLRLLAVTGHRSVGDFLVEENFRRDRRAVAASFVDLGLAPVAPGGRDECGASIDVGRIGYLGSAVKAPPPSVDSIL